MHSFQMNYYYTNTRDEIVCRLCFKVCVNILYKCWTSLLSEMIAFDTKSAINVNMCVLRANIMVIYNSIKIYINIKKGNKWKKEIAFML